MRKQHRVCAIYAELVNQELFAIVGWNKTHSYVIDSLVELGGNGPAAAIAYEVKGGAFDPTYLNQDKLEKKETRFGSVNIERFFEWTKS